MLLVFELTAEKLQSLLQPFALQVQTVAPEDHIPGSFWGDPEAGLINNQLYVRPDTPVHSALHEACHFICMDEERRSNLHTTSGGDYDEENAVCYLQILLSEFIEGFGKESMFEDMDSWGYSFRLGSSRQWFLQDAEDARQWLINFGIINKSNTPTWRVRQ